MPANTAKTAPPTADPQADHAAIAAQARNLQAEAEARRAALMERLAEAEHDASRAAAALAALSAEREDLRRQREAQEDREAQQAQARQAQAHAAAAVDGYRRALSAIEERLAPIAGMIREALEAEDAVWRIEQQRERDTGVAPTLRHTRQRMIDAIRVAGFEGGLDRRNEFDRHPNNMSFGQVPLSAAFSALPAGLADPQPAPAPQALSAHALRPVDVAMPALSADPTFRGGAFDPPPAQPASPQAPDFDDLPPLEPFDPTRS